jgi:hypothetical protein
MLARPLQKDNFDTIVIPHTIPLFTIQKRQMTTRTQQQQQQQKSSTTTTTTTTTTHRKIPRRFGSLRMHKVGRELVVGVCVERQTLIGDGVSLYFETRAREVGRFFWFLRVRELVLSKLLQSTRNTADIT